MIRLLKQFHMPMLLVLSAGLLMQACATGVQPDSGEKIGMHIDAVLEFAVAYPLSWRKDRRVPFGRKQGEVRWTDSENPGTLLRVRSLFAAPSAGAREQQLDQLLQELQNLEIAAREQVTLPAGEAWRVSGHTAQIDLEFYLLIHGQRSYQISLAVKRGTIDLYGDLITRITSSFQVLP